MEVKVMQRREIAKALLAATAGGSLVSDNSDAQMSVAGTAHPITTSEAAADHKPTDLSFQPGNVLRWGADPTGTSDSTAAIQHAIDIAWAAGYYNSPWSGRGGATPIVHFPPGRYRVSDTMTVPTGVTLRGEGHPANTTNHTRIIMDSSVTADNRNRPIFRFNRATKNKAALMNSAVTSSIEDLEFWFVTPGGTFDAPLSDGIRFGAYPDGGVLLFDVDSADFRIVNCVFQHSPAAIRIRDVPVTARKRGDGWNGNRGVGIFIENTEFDASCTHVYATGSELDLQFKNCQFFGSMHRYEGCTGKVVYQSGRWHGGTFVDAASVRNSLERFTLKSADIELDEPHVFLALNGAQLIDVSQNSVLGGASSKSWVEIHNADGGAIIANAINNSGRNAVSGGGTADFVAAIKLHGCRNVLVASNNLTATVTAPYGGFGILSVDGERTAHGNFFNGNAVSAPYEGALLNRNRRYINVVSEDFLGMNYTPQGYKTMLNQ
jgi:hypothetical protein